MFHLNFEQKKDFFRIYLALSKYKVGWRTYDKSPIPPPPNQIMAEKSRK